MSSEYISDSTVLNETNSGGRNLSPVWKFFHREKTNLYGHFSAKCDFFSAKWARGKPAKLEAHLALECSNIEDEVWQLHLRRIACYDDLEELQLENLAGLKKQKLNNKQPEHTFALHHIKECNEIIKFFKKSHQPNSYLHQAICELKIPGGGLKKFVDTRWTSAYKCTLSVSRLECAFIKILSPIRTAITNLKAQSTTLADCFLLFIQIAAAIKKASNLRLEGAGLREHRFETIQQEGHDQYECTNLVAYMRLFCERKPGFNLPYCFETDTPLLWWKLIIRVLNLLDGLQLSSSQLLLILLIVKEPFHHWELVFFGKILSLNDLQEQLESATFLVKDDKSVTEDSENFEDSEISEIEEVEYNNLEIVEHFNIENIVCLNDEIFQDNESDSDSEELPDDTANESDESDNDLVVSDKMGQGQVPILRASSAKLIKLLEK
ncbi:42767_t:CDS:2 [Gigaspora margarita]|uniref:42767_t:CDS:1 n=1 Tax=Gigaspora margarita TaxID=4874 RepID=A0ABM8VVL5_GIGMA|nr:42767_t:CDS:2 [Gigaspora margarita]